MQAADIRVVGELSGAVEVHYLGEMPEEDEGPFLKEERHLLNSIAERMGSIAGRDRAKENIRQNEKYLAALEEREIIGRDLHDDLGQVMGYVHAQAQTALQRLKNRQVDEALGILNQLVEVAQGASANVRKYILGIHTKEYQPPENFFAELEQFLDTQHQHYGLETQVSLPDDWLDSPFSQEVEIQLLRIIQEALTNVRKHAGVAKARLLFTQHANEAQVIIEDEGCGFDTRYHPGGEGAGHSPVGEGDEGHFGLTIMRERAESVGGSLEVRSIPDECTQVIVRVPVMLESTQKDVPVRGIRVLLVDDHPLYLEGLRNLLASRGFQVIGQAHDGLEAIEKTRALHPDLILMDVQMPHLDGVEATRRIKAEFPEVKIVMLTMGSEGKTLFAALRNGASGYLLKSMAGNQFFSLLTQALGGETVLSPSLASQMLLEFAYQGGADAPERDHPTLTSRQQEVVELAAEGLSNKEIAAELNLSENTVKYHVTQILDRLQLKSRHEFGSYLNGERK
ncbi:MAG TPA: response regulator transcription factor family protein [bacterium]|nr:response regulator transcription factor family protein [bacterium]